MNSLKKEYRYFEKKFFFFFLGASALIYPPQRYIGGCVQYSEWYDTTLHGGTLNGREWL